MFVEPEGLASIIGSFLDDVVVLFAATDDSDLDAGVLHVLGALGTDALEQDRCAATLAWTAGQDGSPGTDDDVPADWQDPRFSLGPTDMELAVAGYQARLQDLFPAVR